MLAFLTEPFAFGFMRRALAGCLALSLAAPPLGVFLVLRRMSLMSDVLQHGILPGIAAGFILFGLSLPLMAAGGFMAGLAVALLAGALARATGAREDGLLAAVYLSALALGIAMVSGQQGVDLMHVLFGSVLGVDDAALLLMAASASVVILALAVIWRPLALESFDPGFLASFGGRGGAWHLLFLALVVLCVVAGCAALGTLMSVGLMMLPAVAARHWSDQLGGQVAAAVALAVLAVIAGLLAAWHLDTPTGPAVVLTAALGWIASLVAGPRESLRLRFLPRPHLTG